MLSNAELEQWLEELVNNLKSRFGERLLLAVLVGSRARDDAGEQSDIDVNVILDRVTPDDISGYRRIIESMPYSKMACGYLGGSDEIKVWPRHDLTAFYYGSRVLYGDIKEVIGDVSREDIKNNAIIMLSAINHIARHAMIYDDDLAQSTCGMKDAYKTTFFIIQYWYLLKYGSYVQKRKELVEKDITADDRLVLKYYQNWDNNEQERKANPAATLALLERWSSAMFGRLAETA